MTADEREPTPGELAAMAYVDGELADEARAGFEARLRREPELAREVAALQRLQVLARAAAGPEPMDYEWERIRRAPLHRRGSSIGWALLVAGVLGLASYGVVQVARAPVGWPVKVALGALVAGLAILFVLTLRARLRTLPYDAYTDVKR